MTIQEMLQRLNFSNLSPIQEQVIENFSKSQNIVGLAPTGTGKTHAYLLPLLENIKRKENAVEAVILIPTNELVMQVSKMLEETDPTVNYKSYYGSMDMEREAKKLENSHPNIVITTPAKLVDLVITKNALNLKHLDYFILDEADMMFDEDFMSLLDPVLVNQEIQKFMLFSATITRTMEPFIKKYFGSYIFLDTVKDTKLKINHKLIRVGDSRLKTLQQVIDRINPYLGIIFVSKNEDIKRVYETLIDKGLNVIQISSEIGVKQRKKILEDIFNNRYQYVVSSDLLARGLDFKASHVINYDLPYMLEFFKHRSGRTGRMGDEGDVITLFDDNDQKKIDKLRNKGVPFVLYTLSDNGLKSTQRKSKTYDKKIAEEIKKIPKPKRVTPGYKKKHQEEVKAAIKKVKKARYRNAALRKSRGA
ncbi:DEAD/DEAH box helicase [Acholeplasma hippikon]|uniref:ATP-dependent RNA helicase n=1 Tax=Acholeplasma hippikon TaxID=264636 RepID=A0A449BIC0_9MOLU|nr:DEAD/DEAH box helicase [Acholeplasma hippikon]VEU82182.1 ATP-dependent RNA helicase [Acholeplasma hippikon]